MGLTFKKLTENDKSAIITEYKNRTKLGITVEQLARDMGIKYNVSERTIRHWFSDKLGLKEKMDVEPKQYENAKKKKLNKTKTRYIFTWCQSNTPIHTELWENIKQYAKHIDAEIYVLPGKYEANTTVNDDNTEHTWDERVLPYLHVNRESIHKYLTLLADVNILATAHNPLDGLEGFSGEASSIVGHCRQHQITLPTLPDTTPKILFTTGSVSRKNFSSSKTAKKAEFHHTYGLLIIEIASSELFHARQVTATESGSFCDLYYKIENGKVSRVNEISACVMGDIHCGQENPLVIKQTLNLFGKLKPKYILLHDTFSAQSISHHNMGNPFKQYENMISGKSSLKNEIKYMLDWLGKLEKKYKLVVVRSNHDLHLERWLTEANFKLDRENMKEYIEYSNILLSGLAPKGLIPYIINQKYPKIKTLAMNESFKVKGWELGQHGSEGSNGAKGSSNGFRKLNTRIITAHTHSPLKRDGHVCVGCNCYVKLDYNNKGMSSWVNSSAIIDVFGKIQLIHFIGKEKSYTTFK